MAQSSTDAARHDAAEAARMLRVVVEAVPPMTPKERATARRLEGAALALVAAGHYSSSAATGSS